MLASGAPQTTVSRENHKVLGRALIALRLGSGTQAVQLSAGSRELLAQFGHLVLQPGLGGDQFGAALADGGGVAYEKCPARLRPHRRDAFGASRSRRPWRPGGA